MDPIALVNAPRRVIRVTGSSFSSNAYLVSTDVAGGCLLVDPGLDGALIQEALDLHSLVPRAIVCTHGHFDHLGSAATFQARYRVPVHLHSADLPTARSSNFLLMAMRLPQRITLPAIDEPVHDGSRVDVDGLTIRFVSTPGHTPGSCVLRMPGMAFTGDTLFGRGVGLSGLPGEDTAQLKATLRALLTTLPDDDLVLPGHGAESTFRDIRRMNLALARFLNSSDAGARNVK